MNPLIIIGIMDTAILSGILILLVINAIILYSSVINSNAIINHVFGKQVRGFNKK